MKAAHALVLAFALGSAAPASAKLDLRRADVSHLPNGLTLIMLEDHSFPVVSVQALYKSGSAAEATGKTGLAHFLEHLAFRASEHFPNASATEEIYDAGGEWHGYTAMDQTTYFATMPKDGLGLLLRIEADRMARVTIDPAAIAAEKGAVITELHSYENDPASVLQDAVTRTAIQAHPYGSPMAGYVSDVERLTIDDARAYYASHYAPGNAVLAISGDFNPIQAKALVARTFADVPGRPVAKPIFTAEPSQTGSRRLWLTGPVDRQHFLFAYHAPAASSPDFPALLVIQQILAGTPGLNPRQSGWAGTPAIEGSRLHGTADDIASWLPATREPFLFMISGSIPQHSDQGRLDAGVIARVLFLRDQAVSEAELANAKKAVARALEEDVQTNEDAAHQLAFFEGVGALDALLHMPEHVAAVTVKDIQRVAGTYLTPRELTIGWMTPGGPPVERPDAGNPKAAPDTPGAGASKDGAGKPMLRRLSGGLPALIQRSTLSDGVTVELLLSAPVKGGIRPEELPGLDAIVRSGTPEDLTGLIAQAIEASAPDDAGKEPRSENPETRLQQMMADRMAIRPRAAAGPIAVVVSGNVEPSVVMSILNRRLGRAAPARIPLASPSSGDPRERISKPLAQGALGYIVEGPPPGTRQALAWRMLLYVLTHDYSGRLGRSAIADKGLVYHIYSLFRTDGRRSWVTISTGVDPDKADAMEGELKSQLARLLSDPPTQAELGAARNHILGRDLTSAQSNEEIAAKLAGEFVETGALRSHEQLRSELQAITPADLAAAAQAFVKGAILRVDVGASP